MASVSFAPKAPQPPSDNMTIFDLMGSEDDNIFTTLDELRKAIEQISLRSSETPRIRRAPSSPEAHRSTQRPRRQSAEASAPGDHEAHEGCNQGEAPERWPVWAADLVGGGASACEQPQETPDPSAQPSGYVYGTGKLPGQGSSPLDLPLDWHNAFHGDAAAAEVHADSIPDGLLLSLSNLGRVDIEYIAAITGASLEEVIQALRGSIFQNPETWNGCFYKGWETADEYLSGRLMPKYRLAKEAHARYQGRFEDNLRAIERVLPSSVSPEHVYITLGSPWVPTDIIDEFIEAFFGRVRWYSGWVKGKFYSSSERKALAGVRHDPATGTWHIPDKNRYSHSIHVSREYGTPRMEALHILERTLNMKPIVITDESRANPNSTKMKRVVNHSETMIAQEKQRKLIETFQSWVWRSNERAARLRQIFEDNYSCVRRRIYNGQFLSFPTMAPGASLYPYQKDAVARILFSRNTLLAHDVGSGKTYVMATAGMELRRMGLSSKNLYVVPNNILGQWRTVFEDLYPQARVLYVNPQSFASKKRSEVLKDIRDNDYDGIVMAYSCFEQIRLSASFYTQQLKAKQAEIEEALCDTARTTPQVEKRKKTLDKKIKEASLLVKDVGDVVFFDELGITRLFVDEAHNFKNVPIETQVSGVLGLNTSGSKRCADMLDKVRVVQRANGGGGVVFATGTPITNSITDVYVMQQYLQSGELALLDLQSFDSWVGMFAEQATAFEIDVDTSTYRMATRFSRFHNLPELTSLLASVADFHQVDQSAGIPQLQGRTDALVGKTQDFADYLKNVSHRADKVRHRRVDPKDDNMLKITTDGRKAALDMRLVNPNLPYTDQSKVARCADNVYDLFVRTAKERSAQLVFCDTSTPKEDFNLYDELKRLLVGMGVPEGQIAFVHDAKTEAARAKLFAGVRKGDTRVLVGSTFKLGLGVNVQDRLVALHHLDVPWRPADMTQREGRILRQGNSNAEVKIFRYVTEGSFDAYSWQLLETKQRFISELLAGSLADRDGSDVDGAVLDYAEVKALAVGNPLVKRRVEAANELVRCQALQAKLVESRLALEKELAELPGKIAYQRELLQKCYDDEAFAQTPAAVAPESETKEGKQYRQMLRQRIAQALAHNVFALDERPLMTYRGFSLVLPANMSAHLPAVWVERTGRYFVEMGESESGLLRRIDNCIDGFGKRAERLEEGLDKMEQRQEGIQDELAKNESYIDEIAYWQERVRDLDALLEVE